jgi:hypothetical protein
MDAQKGFEALIGKLLESKVFAGFPDLLSLKDADFDRSVQTTLKENFAKGSLYSSLLAAGATPKEIKTLLKSKLLEQTNRLNSEYGNLLDLVFGKDPT